MSMLEELVEAMYKSRDTDPVEVAADFLRRYEGRKVARVKPQYLRLRARDLQSLGCKRGMMASILNVSDRHVFNLLK